MSYTKVKWIVGVTYDNGWPVFRLRDMQDPTNQIEVQSDAQLIAAAPELLEALKAINKVSWMIGNRITLAGTLPQQIDAIRNQVESAISTAEGK